MINSHSDKTYFAFTKNIEDVLYYIVKYRIHISGVFFVLLLANNSRLTARPNWALIISFTCWHFALYLFDRVYDRALDAQSQPREHVRNGEYKFLYLFTLLLLLLSFVLYYSTGFNILGWLILFPVTFLYTYPLFNRRAKDIFLVKNLYSALLIWSLPLMIQSWLIGNGWEAIHKTTQSISWLFLYVMLGEVLWDIRDSSIDKKYGISTTVNSSGTLLH